MGKAPLITITVNGEAALTVEMAAQRFGVAASTMRGELSRYQVEPAAMLDGRKPVYLTAALDRWWTSRPGRGAPGAPRRRKA